MNELLKNPVIQVNGTATIGPNVESANLCEIKESRVVTTSLRVAEIFGKQHKHVLEAIRNIECSDGFRGSNFRLIQRISDLGQGRTRKDPCYLITRDGFTFLVMGFTGKTAAKFKEAYIRAFNEMEAKLRRRQEAEQLPQPSKPHYTMADMPRMVHPLRGNQRGGGQTCNGRVLQGQGQGTPRAAEGAAETRGGDAAGAEPAANAGRHDAAFRHGYGGDDGC